MAAKAIKKPRKGANGYKLPDPIPQGEILTDLSKKHWVIGKSIGVGGFGELYTASLYPDKSSNDYMYVIKIEPHGNGPLFVEMHFYMRNAKHEDIETWKKKKKLNHLGLPKFISSGSHECKGTKYRFLVMDRYGTDLWHLFLENNRRFAEDTVYKIAIQIIDVLEYIHSRMYVHADIKGGNLLIDLKASNRVFLVDYGLASKVTQKTEYKVDPKKAHNGTIEYTSRDAHMGIPTMRGDFEILGYNIVQWLSGELPWEKNLKDPKSVQKAKIEAFNNVDKFLQSCFHQVPIPVNQFMHLVDEMEFNDVPNYIKFRSIFEKALAKNNHQIDGDLKFNTKVSTTTSSSSTSSGTLKARSGTLKASSDVLKESSGALKTSVKRLKKQESSAGSRTSPRLKAKLQSPPKGFSLDDSTIGVVLDKKREKLKDVKKILESIDDDSETEYDVQILKKKKKPMQSSIPVPVKTAVVRKGRKKKVEPNSDSDNEVVIPKKTTSRKVAEKKNKIKYQSDNSDEDMFD